MVKSLEISKKTQRVLKRIFELGLEFCIPLIMIIIIAVFGDLQKINCNVKVLSVALLVAAFFLYMGLMKIKDAIEENKKESDQ